MAGTDRGDKVDVKKLAKLPNMDPDQIRWYQKYPRFPGVKTCLDLIRNGQARGSWLDLVCYELEKNAADHVEEMIAAFYSEEDSWVQMILLSVIAEMKLPEFTPLLIENLSSKDESLREWAVHGLKTLDTKEARTALWHFQNSDEK